MMAATLDESSEDHTIEMTFVVSSMRCCVCSEPMSVRLAPWCRRCENCGIWASTLRSNINGVAHEHLDEQHREAGLSTLRRRNNVRILERLHDLGVAKGAHVLDVGSAHGWFVLAAREAGYVAEGIEPDDGVARVRGSGRHPRAARIVSRRALRGRDVRCHHLQRRSRAYCRCPRCARGRTPPPQTSRALQCQYPEQPWDRLSNWGFRSTSRCGIDLRPNSGSVDYPRHMFGTLTNLGSSGWRRWKAFSASMLRDWIALSDAVCGNALM